jgi:hypothetical protein
MGGRVVLDRDLAGCRCGLRVVVSAVVTGCGHALGFVGSVVIGR